MKSSVLPLPVGVPPARLATRVQAIVQRALDEQRLVGAVVLVARNGRLVHQQAAGWADREQGRPMAVGSVFRLASVTKPIVSACALGLVAQGRLGLDDGIERWLPDFKPPLPTGEPACITVRQLLSHMAGLSYRFYEADAQGPYALAGVSDGLDASTVSLEENLRRLAGVPLLHTPGIGWRYSLATDVLGALIERVLGMPLAEAIHQRVTGPLGMIDTDFVAREPQRVATAYVSDTPQPHRLGEGETVSALEGVVGITYSPARIFDAQSFASGGAGMAGTAGDFLRLLEALRQGDEVLLPRAWVTEMARDQTGGLELPDAPGFGFGLGFSVLRNPRLAASPESAGTWRWSGAYGHSWFVDPAQGLSVVAFTNTLYEGMAGGFVTQLRDAIYGALAEHTAGTGVC